MIKEKLMIEKTATLFFLMFCWGAVYGFNPGKNEISKQLSLLNNEHLIFLENKGQLHDISGKRNNEVMFAANCNNLQLFITSNGIYYQFIKNNYSLSSSDSAENEKKDNYELSSVEYYRLEMKLIGSNENVKIIKEPYEDYTEHYYNVPNCPEGITNVKGFKKIILADVYPNIDWVIYSQGENLKYDFVVKRGGNADDIKIQYRGANSIKLSEEGKLRITTPFGDITEDKPFTYQQPEGNVVECNYKISSSNVVSFLVSEYDRDNHLIIDPSVEWATYYGGNRSETGNSLTTDSEGNIYLAGSSSSGYNIATSGAYQQVQSLSAFNSPTQDVYIVKFNALGRRIWGTYYGGNDSDFCYAITTDINDDIIIAGVTISTNNIATSGTFKDTLDLTIGGDEKEDGYIAKFNKAGMRLWGTYYGGELDEFIYGVTSDNSGNIIACGKTRSLFNIGSPGSYKPNYPYFTSIFFCSFFVKLDSTGNRIYATYYGAACGSNFFDVRTDSRDNIYLTGSTGCATGIATAGSFQDSTGGVGSNIDDAILIKFNSSGNRLWGTYFGGFNDEEGLCLHIDKHDNIYMGGFTESDNNIGYNGYQNNYIGGIYQNDTYRDGFFAKFDTSGNRILGSYYGGNHDDCITSISTDDSLNIFILGSTKSNSLISTQSGFQTTCSSCPNCFICPPGYFDLFAAKFDANCNRIWGSYFGGENNELYGASFAINDIRYDTIGKSLYFCGTTESTTQIAYNGLQNNYSGQADALLVKISDTVINYITSIDISIIGDSIFCSGEQIDLFIDVDSIANFGNFFFIELSDRFGNFTNSIYLGQFYITSSDTVTVSVPDNVISGNAYRIRAVSSNPFHTGNDNGYNIIISARPATILAPAGESNICDGDTIILNAPVNYKYLWNNGDTTSTVYVSQTGVYQLTITDALGCNYISDTAIVIKHPNPTATIYLPYDSICTGQELTVRAYGGQSYLWSDGNTQTIRDITMPGNYFVIATDTNNCLDTSTIITIFFKGIKPAANFTYTVSDSGTIGVKNLSTGATSYYWIFDNGTNSNAVEPNSFYEYSGDYNVCLIAENDCGKDTICKIVSIVINDIPEINLSNGFHIYPNPFTQITTIEYILSKASDIGIKVYDMLGKLMMENPIVFHEQGTYRVKFENINCRNGIYIIELTVNDTKLIKRIIQFE